MDPAGPERPGLPTGPHPTTGPHTVRMPFWPGPAMAVGGLVVALAAASVATLADANAFGHADPRLLLGLLVVGGLLFGAGVVYAAVRQLRIRRHLPPERYRGPAILLLLVMALVAAGVAAAPFGEDATALLGGDGELSLAGSAVLLVSTQVALLVISWLFVFRPRALAGWPSWRGADPWGAVRAGLGWGLLAWLVATLAAAVVVFGLEAVGIEAQPQAAEAALLRVDPLLAIVAIVLIAPIAEELFFRGVVFNAWLREAGPAFAYVGSAALFAVIHLSVAAAVPIFLLGLAFAWVYRRTGNLLAPITMHVVVNAIGVAAGLLTRYGLAPMPA